MPKKVKSTRISVTVPLPLLADLDRVIDEGYYLSRSDIILDAFRMFLEDHYWKSLATRERS